MFKSERSTCLGAYTVLFYGPQRFKSPPSKLEHLQMYLAGYFRPSLYFDFMEFLDLEGLGFLVAEIGSISSHLCAWSVQMRAQQAGSELLQKAAGFLGNWPRSSSHFSWPHAREREPAGGQGRVPSDSI